MRKFVHFLNFYYTYTSYLGDEDLSALSTINADKPYGDYGDYGGGRQLPRSGITEKRMGTRLRTLKTKLGAKKLSDG